ncbi:unnamed protein product [Calypogeia fissa]
MLRDAICGFQYGAGTIEVWPCHRPGSPKADQADGADRRPNGQTAEIGGWQWKWGWTGGLGGAGLQKWFHGTRRSPMDALWASVVQQLSGAPGRRRPGAPVSATLLLAGKGSRGKSSLFLFFFPVAVYGTKKRGQ